MKNLFEKIAVALGAVAACCFVAKAQVPVTPLLYPLTNTTTFELVSNAYPITTAASSNINSVTFPIWRDRGFTLHMGVYTTNASGSNVNATLQLGNYHATNWSGGGGLVTNWDNSIQFNFANNSGGTSNTLYSTNVPKAIVDNYALGRLSSVTNNHLSTLFLDPTNTYIAVTP